MKYGKGDPTKRRGAWVFGGIQRGEGGAAFMAVCPNNKRTKEALWPIIEENTMIFSDGLQSHKKIKWNWLHPQVGKSEKHYVDPDDRSLHTNKIAGFWYRVAKCKKKKNT